MEEITLTPAPRQPAIGPLPKFSSEALGVTFRDHRRGVDVALRYAGPRQSWAYICAVFDAHGGGAVPVTTGTTLGSGLLLVDASTLRKHIAKFEAMGLLRRLPWVNGEKPQMVLAPKFCSRLGPAYLKEPDPYRTCSHKDDTPPAGDEAANGVIILPGPRRVAWVPTPAGLGKLSVRPHLVGATGGRPSLESAPKVRAAASLSTRGTTASRPHPPPGKLMRPSPSNHAREVRTETGTGPGQIESSATIADSAHSPRVTQRTVTHHRPTGPNVNDGNVAHLVDSYSCHCAEVGVRPPAGYDWAIERLLVEFHPFDIEQAWRRDEERNMPCWHWERGSNLKVHNVRHTLAKYMSE